MKDEVLTSICKLIEEFMSETSSQDTRQDFGLFIKWIRYKHYKKFLDK